MIFVTGTDTGCGKTTVGRAVCAALRRRGLAVGVVKPVETGCVESAGGLIAADAELLAGAAGCSLPPEVICPNRFRLPASPERAAAAEGRTLDPETFDRALSLASAESDFVLVEGAGGLLVPVTPELMMADVAARLGLPLLVVARDALGTVNHTLLTLEAIRARRLPLIGVVFSETDPGPSTLENARAIAKWGRVEVLGSLPYLAGADDETLAAEAERCLELDSFVHPPRRRRRP